MLLRTDADCEFALSFSHTSRRGEDQTASTEKSFPQRYIGKLCLSSIICVNKNKTVWRLYTFDWYRHLFILGKCFVYCNGLMDHICVCENGNSKAWYKAPGHFAGTLVKYYIAA